VRQRWARIVADYEHSGLTQRAFCDRHGFALSSLTRWRRLLADSPGEPSSSFVPVTLAEPTTGPESRPIGVDVDDRVRLRLPNGLVIEGVSTSNVAAVVALVQAL